MKKLMLLSFFALSLSSCAQQTYQFSEERTRYKEIETQNFFFSGVGQEDEFDALTVCDTPSDIVKIETKQKGLSAFLHLITYGIYSPRDITVFCKTR